MLWPSTCFTCLCECFWFFLFGCLLVIYASCALFLSSIIIVHVFSLLSFSCFFLCFSSSFYFPFFLIFFLHVLYVPVITYQHASQFFTNSKYSKKLIMHIIKRVQRKSWKHYFLFLITTSFLGSHTSLKNKQNFEEHFKSPIPSIKAKKVTYKSMYELKKLPKFLVGKGKTTKTVFSINEQDRITS